MIPVTPRGFKDILPEEARWRESITIGVQKVLSSWGYAPIETPTLEVLEVLEQGGQLTKTPFRLFDADGTLLVLRPDVTLPIARKVASRLENITKPLRFRYVQSVFREEESLRAQSREFTQIGVESIGLSGAAADAEVILLLVEALKACGLKEFTVAFCTVGVLRDLLDACLREGSVDDSWRSTVLAACHENNLVAVKRLANDARVEARYATALRGLLEVRGGRGAIEACRQLVEPLGCVDGLDVLAQTYDIIDQLGASDHVTVDFSVMSAFDYYTGLVFEAYAPGLGVPLGSGGRYDRMLESYGASAPAAGFAFGLERVMHALLEQEVDVDAIAGSSGIDEVILDKADPIAAFRRAAELRCQGKPAVLATAREEC
ncbi:MAG: ATP phosphoribosyltransferase regulatory subunit [Coriobacteriaceae bacterium]|nr:ATP phosphoribosyltransferase regulatory subunit [Coriobacteriaceae bacterium]